MAKKADHTPDQAKAFIAELNHQTDRGAGILAAAIIEDQLEIVIQKRLVQLSSDRRKALFGRIAPLSTFSAKIELGFALGLYDDPFHKTLDLIRDVRNKLAHKMEPMTFDHPEIAEIIQKRKPSTTPKGYSMRETFMMCFFAAIRLLYLEGSTEIRIKPLGETHEDIFAQYSLDLAAMPPWHETE